MNDIAYVKGIKVNRDFIGLYHEIKSKVALGVKLTNKERSFYLLLVATNQEAKEFLKNEKK